METTTFKTKILEIKTAIEEDIDMLAQEHVGRMDSVSGGYGEHTLRIHNMCNKLVQGHAPNLYNSIFLDVMCEKHINSNKSKKAKA